MKTTKILLATTTQLLLSIQLSLIAQPISVTDYLVLNSGDTLSGSVEHVNQKRVNPKHYTKIRITDSSGNMRKYKGNDVSAFRVNNNIYEGFWLSQSSQEIVFVNPKYDVDPKNGERFFLRVVSKGTLSHYELEWWEQGESEQSWMDLLKKEEDSFFIRATQGLLGLKKKVLIDYFSNCADLKEQIERKQLNDVREVVDFYNSNCTY